MKIIKFSAKKYSFFKFKIFAKPKINKKKPYYCFIGFMALYSFNKEDILMFIVLYYCN